MKYGQQFERASVPEWSLRESLCHFLQCPFSTNDASVLLHLDNLDYNSLKHEIKAHTTRDQATAIAIPGHQDTALQKFEDGLYLELCRQHRRLDMFITSKADEISRRLGMCVT